MPIRLLLLVLYCYPLAAQNSKCAGAGCLAIVRVKHGTRCGAADSLEMDVQNVSGSLYLLGYVIFLTPSGTANESTGLLAPGDTTNVYVCHALGGPTIRANTGFDKDALRYPDTKVRDTSGLVIRECDEDPDALAQTCADQQAECERNIDAWCEQTLGKDSTPEKSKACAESRAAFCKNTKTECVARIRRCLSGQICAAGACVAIPRSK